MFYLNVIAIDAVELKAELMDMIVFDDCSGHCDDS